MRNKALLFLDKDKSNNQSSYFVFVFDIKINNYSTLSGKKNDTFKKKILKLKDNDEINLFEQFKLEFHSIASKYFIDENGTPFIPIFSIETNSKEVFEQWFSIKNSDENDPFAGYLSSFMFSYKDFEFETVEDIIDYLDK